MLFYVADVASEAAVGIHKVADGVAGVAGGEAEWMVSGLFEKPYLT